MSVRHFLNYTVIDSNTESTPASTAVVRMLRRLQSHITICTYCQRWLDPTAQLSNAAGKASEHSRQHPKQALIPTRSFPVA